MPNLLAHSLIVKRFYNHENELGHLDSIDSFVKGNYDLLVLGSLGPDPLFYMGILPFKGLHLPTALKKIGNKLHKTNGKQFFKLLVESTYGLDNVKEKQKFEAFIFGQLAHYFLDREAHPYILYESGFDDNGRITSHYHFDHAYFETNIDCSLAQKYSITHFLTNPQDIIPDNRRNLEIIDWNLVPVLEKMFGCRLPKHMYSNAINNMKHLLKSMNHHGAFKAKILGKNIGLSAMHNPLEPDASTLNLDKNIWLDPCSGEKHNDSFLELHTRAFELLEACYNDILKSGFNYSTIEKYIDGRDYYGAEPNAVRKFKKIGS